MKNQNDIFLLSYIVVSIYIIFFRFFFDIVGSKEPEYYPLEIVTTIAIILTIILISLIYYENKKSMEENDSLYFGLIIVFFAYFLAENNWLLGRESPFGTIAFGMLAFLVFLFTLKRTYGIDTSVFSLLLLGVLFLLSGTLVDAMSDESISVAFSKSDLLLLEEIFEVFASLFFLHSMYLLYLHLTRKKRVFQISKNEAYLIVICASVMGYGNSFLLEDVGRPIPIYRIVIGVVLYLVGISILIFHFKFRTTKETEEIP